MNISVSRLAVVARPNFCPRCFWIKLKMGWELPFVMPMPGVFRDIDRHVKNVVRTHYEQKGVLPQWFPYLGEVTKLEKDPKWRDFHFTHSQLGITFRGEMDEILQLDGYGYHIVDYKTARYTAAQGELFPMFEAQLNAYAYIAECGGFFLPVIGLSLVYLEPDTDFQLTPGLIERSSDRLMLGFAPQVKTIVIKPASFIEGLLQKAADIAGLPEPPKPISRCQNCQLVERLAEIGCF
jgi:CRISPR/Cas system-associated exonuclease Cas4 (RecB family)